jgi:hypothetical protein
MKIIAEVHFRGGCYLRHQGALKMEAVIIFEASVNF